MASKTNAVRLVEQAGIPCREVFYDFDENDAADEIDVLVDDTASELDFE